MYEDFESAENQEVADPDVQDAEPEKVEETQDTIQPEPEVEEQSNETEGNSDSADRAFAEMRRKVEEYERENAQLRKQVERQDSALGLYVEGEDKTAAAIAQATGLSLEEVKSTIAEQDKADELEAENAKLSKELEDLQVEQRMASDLEELKKIDSSIEFENLPDDFFDLIETGRVTATQAYYAVQQMNAETKATPMQPPGEVATGGEKRTYYSQEEVANMTPEQIRANMKVIDASMKQWK